MKLAIAQVVFGARSKMKKGLWLVASLLVVAVLLAGGCAVQPPRPPEEEEVPVITEGPRWFPESDKNFRKLTESEKDKVTEIALNTPAAVEWQQKESRYRTRIGWIALYPDPSGEGYSGYCKYEYEILETGIPTYPPERIYPNVTIWFGEPDKWVVSVAVDLEAERVVYEEDYPARR